MSDYKTIWETLSKVDVKKHEKKRGKFSYLSWSWAWAVLMEHYPHATMQFDPEVWCKKTNTVTVECEIKIGECSRHMWLPVMDYNNNSIADPDSRQISDARMRCLVKCLALFGLGFSMYAGEDLPDEDRDKKASAAKKRKLDKAVVKAKLFLEGEAMKGQEALKAAWSGYPEEIRGELYETPWWTELKASAPSPFETGGSSE